jgi:hypothetical protein
MNLFVVSFGNNLVNFKDSAIHEILFNPSKINGFVLRIPSYSKR